MLTNKERRYFDKYYSNFKIWIFNSISNFYLMKIGRNTERDLQKFKKWEQVENIKVQKYLFKNSKNLW